MQSAAAGQEQSSRISWTPLLILQYTDTDLDRSSTAACYSTQCNPSTMKCVSGALREVGRT
ncbi:hypothetical protein EYF80_022997 [Liparis tanakae]|uniref:Uncharacterized protein n=1 Tax=Liparis tanakae TaxID=230148 RepID=A0A4Z2HN77_9TELE|nr:hypothetical protein EYF80_022997 [Liparis tanakae]